MKTTIVLFVLGASVVSYAQVSKPQHRSGAQNESLAKPIVWGEESVRMFKDVPLEMQFRVTTSWIPGPDHKGLFRFKIDGVPNPTVTWAVADPEKSREAFVRRVYGCDLTLALYDSDEFLLRKVPVTFALGVDEFVRAKGIHANDAVQMDAQEYKKLSSGDKAGGYLIEWACSP